jgi:hypothetical protein
MFKAFISEKKALLDEQALKVTKVPKMKNHYIYVAQLFDFVSLTTHDFNFDVSLT